MYLDTDLKMTTSEKLHKLSIAHSECASMSELVTGGEIFDALSVLADNPEYLAEILDGHDGVDSPAASWAGPPPPTSRPGAASGEDRGGGGGCTCYCRREVVGSADGCGLDGYGGGGMGKAGRCMHGIGNGALRGVFPDPTGLNTGTVCGGGGVSPALHHNAPPPPLTILPPNSNNIANDPSQNFTSWADPGSLGALEADHGLMYRSDLSYYSASGSESGGDSCSPGYDAASVPPMDFNLGSLDVNSLKDLTNTLNVKQERLPLDPCAYSTTVHVFHDMNVCNKATLEESGSLHQQQPQQPSDSPCALPGGTERVYSESPQYPENSPKYPDSSPQYPDSPPYTGSPQQDGSGTEDYNTFTDGESSPSVGSGSKMKGMKPDRRLRRREQNRQAARRCRQRKKEQGQELVKEYYQLLSANSEMQSKLKLLETEKQRLKDIYEAHLATCSAHLSNTATCK